MVSFYRPQQAKAKNIECELDCQELDLKGQGVCRRDGQICFVPGVLPGEKVRVRGSIGPKGSGRLRLLEVLTPSAQRVAPDCPYLEHCGGCTLQHLPAELALESKIAGLRRLYGKQLKAQLSEPDVIVRSQNLSYRRAARFAVRYDRGRLYLGFREEESHKICDLSSCLTLSSRINAVLPALRALLNTLPQKGKLGHVEVLDSDGGVGITLRYVAVPQDEDLSLLAQFSAKTGTAVFVCTQSTSQIPAGSETQTLMERCISGNEADIYLNLDGVRMCCTPNSFVQINKEVNLKLIALVKEWLKPQDGVRILDLFCGLGNFSFPLALSGAQVVGVDIGKQMIRQAQQQASAQKLALSFYAANLDEEFETQRFAREDYDLAILDPGRKGALRAYTYVLKKKIPQVLMISCNPTVGIRDLKLMVDGGYKLQRWGVLDMFPRTSHVECCVLLERKRS